MSFPLTGYIRLKDLDNGSFTGHAISPNVMRHTIEVVIKAENRSWRVEAKLKMGH